jgi:hypothetical protein
VGPQVGASKRFCGPSLAGQEALVGGTSVSVENLLKINQLQRHTLAVEQAVWVVLDLLRKKRNLNDYSGDLIEPAAVRT